MSQAVPSEGVSSETRGDEPVVSIVPGRGTAGNLPDPYAPTPSKTSRVWWVATTLLIVMAGLFGLSFYLGNQAEWVRILRAFSEAALVGALADWFAVTALFRHPLGIPIPHTGIIPNNQTRIGKSLGLFVQRNFLTAEVLDEQVVNISGSFARFLQSPANRDRVVSKIRALIPKLLEVLHDSDIKKFLNDQVEEVVRSTDLARAAAKGLRVLTSNQMHETLLDELLQQLQSFFRANQLWFRQQLREASPWFVPEIVDRKIFDSIVSKTEQTLSDALSNRNHEFRRRLLDSLYGIIIKLETSGDLQKKGDELKQALLASDGFREYIGALRDGILGAIDTDSKKRDSVLLAAVEKVLLNIVDTLSASPKLQHKLNRIIRGMLSTLVGQESTYVADLISKTIEGWNTKTLVSKLEEQVGADLQYIRINGTLVGGLVGLALYGVGILIQR
jgi:uncharacterized membrane-anchored protein YjiN (DUF445 family)